jgi:cell division protein FtsX
VSIAAAMMAPADPACAWPVQDDATDASIFLSDDITLPQLAELRDALWTDPVVRVVRFEDRSQAFQRFKALWADSPDFVAAVNADDLPQSFRLELAEPAGYRQFAARFQGRAGVSQVIGRACQGTHK